MRLGIQHLAGLQHGLPRGDVGGAAADVLPRIHRRENPDLVGAGDALGLFDHHDRVRALAASARRWRSGCTRRGPTARVAICAVWTVSIERSDFRIVAAGAERVFGAHGVAVHRGAIERRHVHRRGRRRGDHAAARLAQRNALGPRDRRGRLEDQSRAPLPAKSCRVIGPHRRLIGAAPATTCPSSGRISLVIARRTAFSEPGSMKITVPRATPAQARDEHRGAADLLVAERAEELAEAVEPLLEQARDRFVGAVARGDAGAAGGDDRVDAADLPEHRLVHVLRLVAEDLALGDDVPGGFEQLDDGPPADVGFRRARVADRQHGAAHARHGRLSMVLYAHLAIIWPGRGVRGSRRSGFRRSGDPGFRLPTPVVSAFRRKSGLRSPHAESRPVPGRRRFGSRHAEGDSRKPGTGSWQPATSSGSRRR